MSKEPLYPHVTKRREPLFPHMTSEGKFIIRYDRSGYFIITHNERPGVFLLIEWDGGVVYSLQKGERKDVDDRPIEIKDTDPKARIWHEMWEKAASAAESEKLQLTQDTIDYLASAEKLPQTLPRTGTCYEGAWRFLIKEEEGELIHGTLFSGGRRMGHAWVETPTGWVWEPETGKFFAAVGFKGAFAPIIESRYTVEEAAIMTARTKNFGPWSEQERLQYLGGRRLQTIELLASIEGDPIRKCCCRKCGECAPKELLEEGRFLDRIAWLRSHYKEKHPGMWGKRLPLTVEDGEPVSPEYRHLASLVSEPLPKEAD